MNIARLWLGCCFLIAATVCLAADVGIATVVDGKARLLRGTAWYRLVEGTVVRDSDLLDAPEGAQIQIELTDGGALSVAGPGAAYAAAFTPRDAKQPATAEFFVTRGWAKLATKTTESRLRVRTPMGAVVTANAVAVLHVAPDLTEVFVESGSVKCVDPGKGESATGETRAGEFASRAAGRPCVTTDRAPSQFIGAMPRQFMDALPTRAARLRNSTVEPAVDREATFAEIQPWLVSPYRAAFLKRFEPKLADPAFQAAVAGNPKAYPEWSTVVQPSPPAKAEPAKEATQEPKEPQRTWRWPWEKAPK